MRPVAPPTWIVFAASSSRCARTMPTWPSPSGPGTTKEPSMQSGSSYWEIWYPFGIVGIEVVLAVEDRSLRDPAVESVPELDRPLDRGLVRHGQRTGKRKAHRTRARVRLAAEPGFAAAEHLRVRLELHVDLEPDDRFPLRHARNSFASSSGTSMSPRTSKTARYSSSKPCMRMRQSSRSPASSDSRTSSI